MRLPTLALLALLSLAFAALIALGVWQLDRNEWKRDLVAESHARTDAPPLTVQDSAALSAPDPEYRRVEIEEIMVQMTIYGGIPRAVEGIHAMKAAFAKLDAPSKR